MNIDRTTPETQAMLCVLQYIGLGGLPAQRHYSRFDRMRYSIYIYTVYYILLYSLYNIYICAILRNYQLLDGLKSASFAAFFGSSPANIGSLKSSFDPSDSILPGKLRGLAPQLWSKSGAYRIKT